MLANVIGTVEGPARKTLQGIAQVVMLGELAVNQALGNVVPGGLLRGLFVAMVKLLPRRVRVT